MKTKSIHSKTMLSLYGQYYITYYAFNKENRNNKKINYIIVTTGFEFGNKINRLEIQFMIAKKSRKKHLFNSSLLNTKDSENIQKKMKL